MTWIQYILISAFFIGAFFYLTVFRSQVIDRLIVGLFLVCGAIFIVFPNLTTTIANFLGVGRGTDLIFYLFFIAAVFVLVLLYRKISKLAETQTKLIRHLAILHSKEPPHEG